MTRGRLCQDAEAIRERVENALASLAAASIALDDQVALRVKQAIRRDQSLGGLLYPALAEIEVALSILKDAHEAMAEIHARGQARRWSPTGE